MNHSMLTGMATRPAERMLGLRRGAVCPRRWSFVLVLVLCYIDHCRAFQAKSAGYLTSQRERRHRRHGVMGHEDASPLESSRPRLYTARYPLEGGPPQLKLHVAIIVEGFSGRTGKEDTQLGRFVLFDFLPLEPTALSTTFRLLTGGDVRGNVRERELRYLPPGAVCVGETDATFEEMRGFVDDYPDRLSLVSNSCVSFCDAFLSHHRTVNMGGK